MKNFILGVIATLVLFVVGYSAYYSVKTVVVQPATNVASEIVNVAPSPQVFNSIEEVVTFQLQERQRFHVDTVFLGMPSKVLESVTAVCIQNGKPLSKESIVSEYEANRTIYTTLYNNGIPDKYEKTDANQHLKKLEIIRPQETPPDNPVQSNVMINQQLPVCEQ